MEDSLNEKADKIKTINLVQNTHKLTCPKFLQLSNVAKIDCYIQEGKSVTFRLKNHQEYFITGIIKRQEEFDTQNTKIVRSNPVSMPKPEAPSEFNSLLFKDFDNGYMIEVELNNGDKAYFKHSEIDFETIVPTSYNPIRYFIREKITPQLQAEVFRRDNYECKNKLEGCTNLAECCDHIIPVTKGGLTILDNLQASCNHCNLKKGSSLIF